MAISSLGLEAEDGILRIYGNTDGLQSVIRLVEDALHHQTTVTMRCDDGDRRCVLAAVYTGETTTPERRVSEYAKTTFLAAMKTVQHLASVSCDTDSLGNSLLVFGVTTKRARVQLLEWLAANPVKYPVVVNVVGKAVAGSLIE